MREALIATALTFVVSLVWLSILNGVAGTPTRTARHLLGTSIANAGCFFVLWWGGRWLTGAL